MPTGTAGLTNYVRTRDLPRLLGLWPEEIARLGEKDLEDIVARLAKATGAECRRGRSRHWGYDLNRHWALVHAHEAERAVLCRVRRRRAFEQLRGRAANPGEAATAERL